MTRNAMIWWQRYAHGVSVRDIAARTGIGTCRVYQILAATEAKMALRWQFYTWPEPAWIGRLWAAGALVPRDR